MKERKKSKNLLGDVLFPIPERAQNATEYIDIEKSATENIFLKVGPIANFIYDFSTDRFTEMDESIYEITGILKKSFLSNSPGDSLSAIVEQSHSEALPMLIKSSFDLLEEYGKEENENNLIANIEHNIVSKDGTKKRIIVQYIPIVKDESGKPCLNRGCVIDITHIRKDGLPQLFVIKNNRVIRTIVAPSDSIMKNGEIPLSKIEHRIIQRVSEGLQAKEVARDMNISISTLYTHRKHIKAKTGYDINKLISILKEKGLLIQTTILHYCGELADSAFSIVF
jgi:DNA-binding CsgD family transcriptional regulator